MGVELISSESNGGDIMAGKFKTIKPMKASDLIVQEIWKMILHGDLNPGDKLPPERELGKKFGVSMVTLREALQTLESYGHITKKRGANGGSIILDIAPTQGINLLIDYLKKKKFSLDDLIEAKQFIDPLIGELAYKRLSANGKKAFRTLIKEHKKDFESRGASKCGWKYYTLMGELTGNPILLVIAELLTRLLMEVEFSHGVSDLDSPADQLEYNKAAYDSHRRVAEVFSSENTASVRKELVKNSRTFAKAIRNVIKQANK